MGGTHAAGSLFQMAQWHLGTTARHAGGFKPSRLVVIGFRSMACYAAVILKYCAYLLKVAIFKHLDGTIRAAKHGSADGFACVTPGGNAGEPRALAVGMEVVSACSLSRLCPVVP